MTKQEYLASLKVGDTVNRFFHGAGFITQGDETEVVYLTESHIWVDEVMHDESNYKTDSVYAYHRKTGKAVEAAFGMFHTLELPGERAPDSDYDD